jgi:hypothetical protein
MQLDDQEPAFAPNHNREDILPTYMPDVPHQVPEYSAVGDGSVVARVKQTDGLTLPILHAPKRFTRHHGPGHFEFLRDDAPLSQEDRYTTRLEQSIIQEFFAAVRNGQDDVVAEFISGGLVSPDVTSLGGETPLLAAVQARNVPMVSRLVALGATVNAFGRPGSVAPLGSSAHEAPERTPLQFAAQEGNLALVKVFIEDYGADDSLVAPDGAIALRLAAANNHREIVDYLPARRAGGRLRWKKAHEKELERIRKAVGRVRHFVLFFIWHLPKAVVYDAPKETGKYLWKNRRRIGSWMRRLPAKIGHRIQKVPKYLREGAKMIVQAAKKIPGLLRGLARALWKLVLWCGNGLKIAGQAVGNALLRLVSWLHTTVTAIVSFFQQITLKDVWNGFYHLMQAIFIDGPKAILGFLATFSKASYEVLKEVFGLTGKVLWYIGYLVVSLAMFIPKQLWVCARALWTLSSKGWEELMALVDPKRM